MLLNDTVHTERCVNSTAAGTTNINGSTIDLAAVGGWDNVRFTCLLGALTATQVTKLKAQAGNAANGSDMADIAGAVTAAAADADSNKLLILDVNKSLLQGFRYVRAVVVRGTANAAIDGVIADLYKPHTLTPQPAADSTVSQQLNAF